MMMIRLVTIFVAILIQVACGEACTNNGTKAEIQIYNCDIVSYQNLARDFQTGKITSFGAGKRNNEFPTIVQKMFQNMTGLIEVWLYDCKIERIDENAFASLVFLSSLSLKGNKIKTLHVNTFRKLGNLKKLYLFENQIEELPAKLFERNLNLKTLHLDQNEIQELPAGLFGTLTELEELAINENKLEIVHGSTFRNNENLKKLYLRSNKIEAVEEETFDELKKLTLLNLKLNRYINTAYGSNDANNIIDLTQVSSDLSECYKNYNTHFNITKTTTTKKNLLDSDSSKKDSLDCECKTTSLDISTVPMLIIYAAIVTILFVIAIIVIIKLNAKIKNAERKRFEVAKRESFHYYSQADEIAQPAHEYELQE
jgi:Leucine-rich repeat (LRR) protein